MVTGFAYSVVCFLNLHLNATNSVFKIIKNKPDSCSDNLTRPFGVDRKVHM